MCKIVSMETGEAIGEHVVLTTWACGETKIVPQPFDPTFVEDGCEGYYVELLPNNPDQCDPAYAGDKICPKCGPDEDMPIFPTRYHYVFGSGCVGPPDPNEKPN